MPKIDGFGNKAEDRVFKTERDEVIFLHHDFYHKQTSKPVDLLLRSHPGLDLEESGGKGKAYNMLSALITTSI